MAPPSRASRVSLAPVSIVVWTNPGSGRGRAEERAREITWALGGEAGIVLSIPGGQRVNSPRAAAALRDAKACIVVGGDGTLHAVLPALIESRVPVYHAAMGTENLFSREFFMRADAASVVRAVEAGRVLAVDAGEVVGAGDLALCHFALMFSAGPDAGVTRRLAAARRGSITHATYARPVLAELADPFLPVVDVNIDGRDVVRGRRGWLLICNSRQYGFRADPGLRAVMTDGLLDCVFFPADSGMEALTWVLAARTRKHLDMTGIVYVAGGRLRVRMEAGPVQADGDYLADATGEGWIDFRCLPRALNVLLPG